MTLSPDQLGEFATWAHLIQAEPQKWLAPIIRSGRSDLAEALIREKPELLNVRFSGNETSILVAACARQHDLTERLIRLGAPVDFITAIVLGRTQSVRAMLNANPALVNRCSPEGWGAQHMAARFASPDLLAMLLDAGADVNGKRNHERLTPLFFAHEKHENAELLLDKGADIDARDKNGFSPLHWAAWRGDAGFAQFLLSRGARTDVQTDGRQTPWALAVRRRNHSLAALL